MELKQKLPKAPVLSLPPLEKPFDLYVNVGKGIFYEVLTQEWGGVHKPVAYLSKLLDLVTRGWPVCIHTIADTATLVTESYKIIFGGKLTVHTPHSIKAILNQRVSELISDP